MPARCQAMGGARAWNSAPCDAVRSNSAAASSRSRPKTLGSANDGVSAGTNAPARWISVQIGQQSSARSSRPGGEEGALGSSGDACVLASAVAPAETGTICSRCTCPNETASWNASASSARYEPTLERDRNQFIVVTLRASDHAEPLCQPVENFSYNVTSPQSGRDAIHPVCCQKSTYEKRPAYGRYRRGLSEGGALGRMSRSDVLILQLRLRALPSRASSRA